MFTWIFSLTFDLLSANNYSNTAKIFLFFLSHINIFSFFKRTSFISSIEFFEIKNNLSYGSSLNVLSISKNKTLFLSFAIQMKDLLV